MDCMAGGGSIVKVSIYSISIYIYRYIVYTLYMYLNIGSNVFAPGLDTHLNATFIVNRGGQRLRTDRQTDRCKYLSLGEVKVHSDLVSPQARQVVVVGELGLQLANLLLGERRPLLPGFTAHVRLVVPVLGLWKSNTNAHPARPGQSQWIYMRCREGAVIEARPLCEGRCKSV